MLNDEGIELSDSGILEDIVDEVAGAPEGRLVLSGLLERDLAGVLDAYGAQGFSLGRRSVIEGWATLVLARGGAKPRRRRVVQSSMKR